MFTGVQILEPKVFSYMDASHTVKKFSTTRDTYPRMVLQHERFFGFRFDGFWRDLGTKSRIREAEEILAREKSTLHYL
jgi:NDP-sugar pyrophosphorylase family protein